MTRETGTDAALSVPRNTTPTWEVELLISGVAVFAMLQLPGLLDDAIFALRPRFGATWAQPLGMLYVYAKTAAVILAATFVIHLLLRARWIALVGLLSIHPRGIDWDRLEAGPLTREVEQARMGSLDDAVERADNQATTVFAVGVTLATVLVTLTLVVGAVMALASVVPGLEPANVLLGLFAVVMLPFVAVQLADRHLVPKLAPAGRTRRVLRAVVAAYARIGFGAASNPVMGILSSHGGRRRVAMLMAGIMMLATLGVTLGYYAMRNPARMGSYALFPRPEAGAPGVLATAHYDDQRDARDVPAAYIQSAVVIGPYLRLVVPYEPVRDEAALERDCPGLRGLERPARATRALACLQRLHPLQLDGKPLPVRYEIGSDARNARPALVAMVDVRALPRGRHELQVGRAPDPDADATRAQDDASYRIPFWR